jgi:CheY-like chemotaxis protein
MTISSLKILLADDDSDDCMFFREALEELKLSATLTVVNDGEELMNFLSTIDGPYPHALFLDLNMPRKNGFECLTEIRKQNKYNKLPIIIYTTSANPGMVDEFYRTGASYYVRKPAEFYKLKNVIGKSIGLISDPGPAQVSKENFVVLSE